MPSITVVDRDGSEQTLEAKTGHKVMEIIRDAGMNIEAACGGCCACATCHVYVGETFLPKLKEKDDMEDSMLDFAEAVQDNSRLSCQILMKDELDGIEVSTPESQ